MRKTGLLLAFILCLSPDSLTAQQPHRLWASGAIGPGWAGATCEGCNAAGRFRAVSGLVRAGTDISPSTLVGLELSGWTRTPLTTDGVPAQDANERLLSASLIAVVYPLRSRRFLFVRAGLGVAQYRSSNPFGTATSTGLAPSLGAGVDVSVAGRLHLTPVVQYLKVVSSGELRINDEAAGLHFHPDLVQLGVGLTYR
jgi:hypothetical protein